ncbi:MAG: sulfide/dihydroorotate dehydrogenase-like FAD/NAD-binding protein [Candidatus Thorarchaeota archaeon]|nr:MAG: sulfide/dihydroorotate dehydrogenase-like FAD/NAD-binding protein [Candidatus Thorarchaeota archaeon]
MYEIKAKRVLNPSTKMLVLTAPDVTRVCRPGQFVMVRANETGERIPLTIADCDRKKGEITIVFQEVGKSTKLLGSLEVGQSVQDVVGPLGKPTEAEKKYGTVVVIGGGCGTAICYPVAKAFKEAGNYLITINGARTADLLIFRKEMEAISDEMYETTDDGTCGVHGFVTTVLGDLIQKGKKIDLVFAVGPVPMMKFVSKTTEPKKIPTVVSLNSLMVDATGMCGACRVTVGGQMRFTCVDGPDFDGHQVDYNELMGRLNAYRDQEVISDTRWSKEHGGSK